MSLRTGWELASSSRLLRSMEVSRPRVFVPMSVASRAVIDCGDRFFFFVGIGLGEERLDLLGRREHGADVADAEQVLEVVHRLEVVRVGQSDGQRVVLERDRHELVELGHLLVDQLDGVGMRLDFLEVGDAHAVDFGGGLKELLFLDESALDGEVGEPGVARAHILVKGFELRLIHEAEVDEFLAELPRIGIDVGELVLRRCFLGRRGRGRLASASRRLAGGRFGRRRCTGFRRRRRARFCWCRTGLVCWRARRGTVRSCDGFVSLSRRRSAVRAGRRLADCPGAGARARPASSGHSCHSCRWGQPWGPPCTDAVEVPETATVSRSLMGPISPMGPICPIIHTRILYDYCSH